MNFIETLKKNWVGGIIIGGILYFILLFVAIFFAYAIWRDGDSPAITGLLINKFTIGAASFVIGSYILSAFRKKK